MNNFELLFHSISNNYFHPWLDRFGIEFMSRTCLDKLRSLEPPTEAEIKRKKQQRRQHMFDLVKNSPIFIFVNNEPSILINLVKLYAHLEQKDDDREFQNSLFNNAADTLSRLFELYMRPKNIILGHITDKTVNGLPDETLSIKFLSGDNQYLTRFNVESIVNTIHDYLIDKYGIKYKRKKVCLYTQSWNILGLDSDAVHTISDLLRERNIDIVLMTSSQKPEYINKDAEPLGIYQDGEDPLYIGSLKYYITGLLKNDYSIFPLRDWKKHLLPKKDTPEMNGIEFTIPLDMWLHQTENYTEVKQKGIIFATLKIDKESKPISIKSTVRDFMTEKVNELHHDALTHKLKQSELEDLILDFVSEHYSSVTQSNAKYIINIFLPIHNYGEYSQMIADTYFMYNGTARIKINYRKNPFILDRENIPESITNFINSL